MDIPLPLVLIAAGFIVFILYYVVLIKLGIIRKSQSITITNPDEYARNHIVLRGRLYAKMSSQVLHKSIFYRTDVVGHFRWINYPVFIIFGSHICYRSYRFLKAFKENKNIRLFQIRKDTYKDASDEVRAQIEKYLQEREYATIVDGVHCYVASPHKEGEELGGTEYINDPILARKYERDFDNLMRYCTEVDREKIVDSVGEENIYLTKDDGTYGKATHEQVLFLKAVILQEPMLPSSIGFGEDSLVLKLKKQSVVGG